MVLFDPPAEEQRKRFFRQSYGAHLPGYTGHCPTLKFRVGKRFGANTEEIMKELLEKKILKTGPYRPNSERHVHENSSVPYEQDVRRDWKNEAHLFKAPPYILGYTGYIPGFHSRYGLSFVRAVEEGAREWRENQSKLKARRDAIRAQAGRSDSGNLLSRARAVDAATGTDRSSSIQNRTSTFHYEISPESPPIVGYTGHIPGAKGEVALSRRYAQAAKKGLQLVRKEREERLGRTKDTAAVQRVFEVARLVESEHTRA